MTWSAEVPVLLVSVESGPWGDKILGQVQLLSPETTTILLNLTYPSVSSLTLRPRVIRCALPNGQSSSLPLTVLNGERPVGNPEA